MNKPKLRRRVRSGATLIEGLVATIIIAFCIMGVMNLWGFAAQMTNRTDRETTGYNLARLALENARAKGFYNAADSTLYYDIAGGDESATQGTRVFRVAVVITADKTEVKNGVTTAADNAIRTVIVTVTYLPNNQTAYKMGSILARAGI